MFLECMDIIVCSLISGGALQMAMPMAVCPKVTPAFLLCTFLLPRAGVFNRVSSEMPLAGQGLIWDVKTHWFFPREFAIKRY